MKKHLNRFFVFLSLIISLVLLSGNVFAAGLTIRVGTGVARPGENIQIPIYLEDIPAAGINNADFIIGYDTDVVEAVSVSAGEIVPRPNIDFYHAIHNDRGQVNFLFADEDQMRQNLIHDDGVFAYIEFEVLSVPATGFSEIFVKSVGAIADYDLNVYDVATESGGITIQGDGPGPEIPAAPTLSSAVAGDRSVSLSWSRVDNADGYKVKYGTRSGNYTEEIEVGNRTSYTVSGLINGTRYYFAVVAYNTAGESRNSNELSATPETGSGPITGQIELELSQNTETTTNTINPIFRIKNIGSSSISLSDLEIRYYYTIDGEQPQNFWCDHAAIVSPSYNPITSSVTGSFTKMPESTSGADYYLSVKFTGNNTLAAGAIAEIQTRFAKNNWTNYNQSNDFSFNDASKVAVFLRGELIWGSTPDGTGPVEPEVPAAPVLSSAVPGDGSVSLSWSRVDNADGYKVKYGTRSGIYTEEIEAGNRTSYTLSGLTNGTRYYFAVVAYNAVGESENSNELSATPVKEVTEGLTISIGTAKAARGETVTIPVRFEDVPPAGINNADFIIGYDTDVVEAVSVNAGEIVPRPNIDFYHAIHNDRGQVNFLFADEEQMQNYLIHDSGVFAYIEFRVLSDAPLGFTEIFVKSVGAIADYDLNVYEVATESGGITVEDSDIIVAPDAPVLLNAVPGIESVTLEWSRVDNADGYRVKYGTRSGNYTEEIEVGNRTSYTVSGLTNGTRYYFAVVAYNAAGESRNSNELSATPVKEVTEGLTISIGTAKAARGETVTIPVRFEDVPEAGINNADFIIGYDTDVVEAVSVSAGEIVPRPNIDFYHAIHNDRGQVNFLFADEEQMQNYLIHDSGVFAYIEFRVLSDAPLGFTEIFVKSVGAIADYDLNVYEVATESGGITVEDSDIIVAPDAPVLLNAVPGIESVTLEWSRVDNADGYKVKYGTVSGAYTEEIDVASTTAYTVSGLTGNLRYYFVVSAYNAAGESANSNQLSAVPEEDDQITGFTIAVGTVSAEEGETITVPIRLVNVPVAGINNADFIIGYDRNALEAVSVSAGEIVPRPNIDFYHAIHNDRGQVNFLFADEEQMRNYLIYDDGVFAYIEFKVLPGAPTGLSKVYVKSIGAIADYDLNVYDVDTRDGGVNIN